MGKQNYTNTVVPLQKLPASKKNEEWKEACIDGYIGKASNSVIRGRTENEDLRIKYDLYNGKFDIKDIEYVTDPYKVDEGFPASPMNFNIVRSKIDLLIGEESKRPSNIKVIQSGDMGASKAAEAEMQLLMQSVMSVLMPEGQQPEGEQPQTPEQIQKYMRYSYSDVAETTAHYALRYLKEKLNLPNNFLKGFKDLLIGGKEIHYVGVIGNEPFTERVNPIGFSFDKSPELEFIEQGDWAVRHMKMTPATIYDRLYDVMSESDLNKLLDDYAGTGKNHNTGSTVNYSSIQFKTDIDSGGGSGSVNDSDYVDVYHVTWRSYKKLGFLTYTDEEGEIQEELVDESYKFDDDDRELGNTISWDWYTEIWEGYKVGDDIYLGIQPVQGQSFSMEKPEKNLPYYGGIYSDDNSEYTSLIDIMRPLQYMYIIVWYRLEQALARDKGRILNMDVTQIPKSFGMDLKKWMHYLSAFGVNFINPHEEGYDIPGRAGGASASFNQISSQDLSMSKVIADYIGLLNKIEDMVGELSGVTRQRQGSISSNELVGNVERSVVQSSHITEPLFWKHNQIKKNVYAGLLEAAKAAWADGGRQSLHFVLDDTSRVFLNISKDFAFTDFDVFVSDSSKEDRDLQALKNLAAPAIQSGVASLSDAAQMLTMESVLEIKNKLKELEEKKQQMEQQQAQAEQQAAMQQQQMMAQIQAESNRIKEEDSIRQAETAIEVAMINADIKISTAKGDSSEQIKVQLQKEKQDKELSLKDRQVQETVRSNRNKEELKRKELDLKRTQINKQPKKTSK